MAFSMEKKIILYRTIIVNSLTLYGIANVAGEVYFGTGYRYIRALFYYIFFYAHNRNSYSFPILCFLFCFSTCMHSFVRICYTGSELLLTCQPVHLSVLPSFSKALQIDLCYAYASPAVLVLLVMVTAAADAGVVVSF